MTLMAEVSDCPNVPRALDYVTGVLSGVERERFEQHLDGCESCSAQARTTLVGPEVGSVACETKPPRAVELGSIHRYLLSERLGTGAMGAVYLAHDPDLARDVAIKVVHPKILDRLGAPTGIRATLREAQAMAQVSHPNIVSVFDVGTFRDQVFIAMEYLDGGDLGTWLEEQPRNSEEILTVFRAAGAGLAAAHSRGLVHRDFKPRNVLLDSDGTAKVGDFGVARAAVDIEPALPSGAASASLLGQSLTSTGGLVGTPAYMAPEQLAGCAADHRADQFSFCVALYRSLYGKAPYAGTTVAELSASMATGDIEIPAARADVPKYVRSALLCGLATEPSERFASMSALLAALSRPSWLGTARRRVFAAVVATAAIAASIAVAAGDSPANQVCAGGAEQMAEVWNPEVRTNIRAAFHAANPVGGTDTFAVVARQLDSYASDWALAYRSACEATRVHGVQSEALLDTRMRCLRRRRFELQASVALISTPDEELVTKASQLVPSVLSIAECADIEALTTVVPPPEADQAEVEHVERGLAEVRALLAVGRVDAGTIPVSDRALRSARELAYPPLLSEAALLRAQVLVAANGADWKAAEGLLEESLLSAERGRDDVAKVRAFLALAMVYGRAGELDSALRWSRYARATLRRHRPRARSTVHAAADETFATNMKLAAELETTLSRVYRFEDRLQLAVEHGRRAVDLYTKAGLHESVEMAQARGHLGHAFAQVHSFDEAALEFIAERDLRRRLEGEHNPMVAVATAALAEVRTHQGRNEDALALSRESLVLLEQYYGPGHPRTSLGLTAYAMHLDGAGKYAEASQLFETVVEIKRLDPGPNSKYLLGALQMRGMLQIKGGDYAAGVATLQEAIALGENASNPRGLIRALDGLGGLMAQHGKFADAETVFRRARTHAERLPQEDRLRARVLERSGAVFVRQKKWRAAIEPLESALASHRVGNRDAKAMASTRFELAQAFWGLNRRRKAHRLAEQAQAASQDSDRQKIDAWLAEHTL